MIFPSGRECGIYASNFSYYCWVINILICNSRLDKKANEVQVLQNKLAQAKAQIDKLTNDLMKSHDDKDRLAKDNAVSTWAEFGTTLNGARDRAWK